MLRVLSGRCAHASAGRRRGCNRRRSEERRVGVLDDTDGSPGELGTHLRGHLGVGAGPVRHVDLVRPLAIQAEPPGAGQHGAGSPSGSRRSPPGQPAVIDIQVSVADLDEPRLTDSFAAIGASTTDITADHVPAGDPGSEPAAWEKRYFRAPASWRPAHLHVRAAGRPNQRDALLFRDYLRHSPAAAGAYAGVKLALARLHPDDVTAYYDIKDPVCDVVMDAAERWAADVGWSPQAT